MWTYISNTPRLFEQFEESPLPSLVFSGVRIAQSVYFHVVHRRRIEPASKGQYVRMDPKVGGFQASYRTRSGKKASFQKLKSKKKGPFGLQATLIPISQICIASMLQLFVLNYWLEKEGGAKPKFCLPHFLKSGRVHIPSASTPLLCCGNHYSYWGHCIVCPSYYIFWWPFWQLLFFLRISHRLQYTYAW